RHTIGVGRHLVGQFLGVALLVTFVTGDACDYQTGGVVAADEVRGGGRRRGPRRRHLRDVWRTAQLVDDVVARGASRRAVNTVGCGDDDQQLHIAVAELVGQELGRTGRFGRRVLES